MKILVVSDGMLPPGVYSSGMSIVYKLQRALKDLNVDVQILTCYYSWAARTWSEWTDQETKKTGITIHCLRLPLTDKAPVQSFYASRLAYFFKALKLHSKENFDIIHEYSSSPLLFWRTGMYKMFSNVRTVHTLCTSNLGFFGTFKFSCGVLKHVDRIICTTKAMKKGLLQYYVHTNEYKNKIIHLPLGVNVERFCNNGLDSKNLRVELRIPFDAPVVLYVGPIEAKKGVFLLLQAAKMVLGSFPNAIFVLAVPGPLNMLHENYLENMTKVSEMIRKFNESFRILRGHHDIPLLMKMADIFVLPQTTSHGTLGYPLTLLEAMASGKAIVASDTEGVNELILDGYNGLLFSRGNIDELAKKIGELVSSRGADEMGRNARRTARHYDLRITARTLKKIYESILMDS